LHLTLRISSRRKDEHNRSLLCRLFVNLVVHDRRRLHVLRSLLVNDKVLDSIDHSILSEDSTDK
jgi:hypothetical protein